MKQLILVESPTKARTIKNFLGEDYEIIASKGHIRDLPKHAFGIKIENQQFIPDYVISKDHATILSQIKEVAKHSKKVFIATDEDREGEAIGYHIAIAIGQDPLKIPRIAFHEITETAIKNALKHPRQIAINMVNAQQARRLLDRIVGYRLSPLLSAKIQKGLSAGRVQSSALKIIIDREREIRAFKPIIYYHIAALFEQEIEAEIMEYMGKKIEKMEIRSLDTAKQMIQQIEKNKDSFRIHNIEHKKRKISPQPPFMTSTLQQTASTQLGFSPARTMSTAQKLYEGVPTHQGTMGVITYMRTDSLNIAKEAIEGVRELISNTFEPPYLPVKPRIYTTKSKNAQEAHEAIRPTNLSFTPDIAKGYISGDELKLYTLIYQRFIASQMTDAEFELQNITFKNECSTFKANGRKLLFDGFYAILENTDKDKLLPNLKKGDSIALLKVKNEKKQTEPPARFSEASLIKMLESLGIGRPSTYAPTITLLVSRNYITLNQRQIVPEEIAFKVTEMLEQHFSEIVDSHFSAKLEEKLDLVASEEMDWQKALWEFYEDFDKKIKQGKTLIQSQKIATPTGEYCPQCGCELVERDGRYGKFIACSGYPKCKYIQNSQEHEQLSYGECEKCGKPMVVKMGRNGRFIACSGYPKCKNTKPIIGEANKTNKILEVKCPKCQGNLLERFSKRGAFFGCSNYPKCDFISKYPPTNKKCPSCQNGLMAERTFRKKEIYECVLCKYREDREGI
ncbi:DNA topoisomerase I [Helicobacter monodelphidis]|uniref:type I DNA topoisomerase n=1 Tax=Helicobacter sp. 15-1451 TaxID=2004995 RepID=UPI000DCEDF84|nr:type I DNA topoisomerase [Helicobacter sp. 15-1451]RAX59317.1 DNA topoisomerase I [Helicobacter sp. 15-1451]